MKVLAIETSCDETSMAVVEGELGQPVRIISHVVYSQIELHKQYGGVFPEAASREHVKKIGLVLEQTINQAASTSNFHPPAGGPTSGQPAWLAKHVDAIAVTAGPGLIGSLLVGVNLAKTLAYTLNKPLLGINHHEGHISAAWINPSSEISNSEFLIPKLPALALIVSGGHTKLVWIEKMGVFHELGRTRDDAAGEAFDKVARLLGLPYPGGPAISKLAAEFSEPRFKIQDSRFQIKLPRPMLDTDNFDFSFSGLKTAVARLVAKQGEVTDEFKRALAYEFQEAVTEVLTEKTLRAIKRFKPKSVIMAGGVASDRRLRAEFIRKISELPNPPSVHIPPPGLCTDNGAMIGAAALNRLVAGQVQAWYDVQADDNMPMSGS